MFLISSLFNFFTINFIAKNSAKNINAKIVSDVWVKAVAESDNATRIYPCFISILIMLQKKNKRNDCDKIEGQWPQRNPIEAGKEKISIDNGSEIKATVLLKFLIIKYMIKLAIMAKNTTMKYMAS